MQRSPAIRRPRLLTVITTALASAACNPPATPAGSVQQVLRAIGIRKYSLKQHSAVPASGDSECASALAASLEDLRCAGVDDAASAALIRRNPRVIDWLIDRRPGPLLSALSECGVPEVADLLSREPSLLELQEERLARTLDFLSGYVGLDRLPEFILAQPQALLWRPDGDAPVICHLRDLGVAEAVLKRIGKSFPSVLQLASRQNVENTICYLQTELKLSTEQLSKIVCAYPQLLGLKAKILPTATYLREIGAQPERVIPRHPQVLGLSLEANLRPTVAYLRSLGVDVARAINTHPAMLSLGLASKMIPTVAYLEEQGMQHLGRAISAQPAILSLSVVENLKPKIDFLRSLGMRRLGAQLDTYPALLSLSLEQNLKPTAEVLGEHDLLKASEDKLRARHLAASLELRIRPRLQFCLLRGRQPTLNLVTTVGDAKFCSQLQCGRAEWDEFLASWRRTRKGVELDIPWLPDGIDLMSMLLSPSIADPGGSLGAAQCNDDQQPTEAITSITRPQAIHASETEERRLESDN